MVNRTLVAVALSGLLVACSSGSDSMDSGHPADDAGATSDAGAGIDAGLDGGAEIDGGQDAGMNMDGGVDAGMNPDGGADAGCFIASTGVFGECMDTTVCTAMSGYSPTAGYCPGPANIECCSLTPDVANNPAVPAGWKLMMQSEVTTAMTNWAVMILHDPVTYPMFSTTMMTFGTLTVMARVEWHPPDFQNNTVHRGVTLYEPV